MTRTRWIAAALFVAAGWFFFRPAATPGRTAFAADIPGVDAPQTITWTSTFYSRYVSVDGKRTWLAPERRLHAYRAPGQYRETMLDKQGQPAMVEITDVGTGRTLVLDLKEKKATLKMRGRLPDVRGPFAWVGDALRDGIVGQSLRVQSVSLQGRKEVDKTQANVVRVMIDNGSESGAARRDLLFDVTSKRLVAIWEPNDAGFDLETALERTHPAEATFFSWTPIAVWEHEIVVDSKLAAVEFSLDPPPGYAFEAIAKPTVTEEEMITYLGAVTRFNGRVFPDSAAAAFDREKFNAASLKAEADQTPVERALIAIRDKIMLREIYRSPVFQFRDDHAEPGSFRYVGAGTKLGQADRIVCWFTPKGTTRPRAVFGDLSVRDVAPSDLPLDLGQ